MSTPRPLPLSDVIVVELGTIIAGPFAGSLLADMGATIIKVENPRQPDALRQSGAKFEGVPIWWGVASRNKKCVSLDLKQPLGKATFEKLVAKADVLIENYRPGTLDKLGLGVESVLRKINPGLVVLSISGYGQDVRHAQKPGFGKIAEGLSGMVPLTGPADRAPLFTGFSLADASTGLLGALSICMMLLGRERAPKDAPGPQVDLALYESLLRMMDFQFHRGESGPAPTRQGHNNPAGWGYDDVPHMPCVRTKDGAWVQVWLDPDKDLDFLPDGKSLAEWAAGKSHKSVVRALARHDVPAVEVRDGGNLASDPYFRKRGDVVTASHPVLGDFPVTGFFPKGERDPSFERFNAAAIGEHNEWVYRTFLGLSDEEYAALREQRAI